MINERRIKKEVILENILFTTLWICCICGSLIIWKSLISGTRYSYGFFIMLIFFCFLFIWKKEGLTLAVWIIQDIVFQGYVGLGKFFFYQTVYLGISQLLLIFIILYSIYSRTMSYEGLGAKRPFSKSWIIYLILFFISALRSGDFMEGGAFFQQLALENCILYFLVSSMFRKTSEIKTFFRLLIIFGIFCGILAAVEYFTGEALIGSGRREQYIQKFGRYGYGEKGARIGGFFINPNMAGGFWSLLTSLVFALFINEKKGLNKLFLGLGVLVMLFSLLVTFSRGSIFALPIGILFVLWMSKERSARVWGLFIFIIAALLFSGFYSHFQGMIRERTRETREEMSREESGRLETWGASFQMIKEHPVLGIGGGVKPFVANLHKAKIKSIVSHPHNSYLHIATAAGLPCLLILLWMLKRYFSFVYKALKRREDSYLTASLIGLVGGILSLLTNAFTDYHLLHPQLSHLFWLFIGLSIVISNHLTEGSKDADKRDK